MKTVKLFEQFVNESQGSQFSHAVLTALEPTILEMVETIKKQIIEDYAKKGITYTVNSYEEKILQLGLIIDMLKSFEKYTEPTDKLIKLQASGGRKGIEIYAVIERDGQEYDYFTEAISAGGYNIQSFHYRYLTKTKLPNGKVKGTLADEYAQKLKSLTKAEKLNASIKHWEERIEANNQHIARSLAFTDEEILADYYAGDNVSRTVLRRPVWKEVVKNGAAKNYNNDENYFNQQMAEYDASNIDFWKKRNIVWKQQDNATGEKEIKKLTIKLDQLTSQS